MSEQHDTPEPYFDATVAGRRVQADGGTLLDGQREGLTVTAAAREAFEGTLTGRRLDIGNPPWRWLEIGDLTVKPDEFSAPRVWCEETFIFYLPG